MHPHVSQLTLEEKAGLLSGGSFWKTRAVDRLGIPSMVLTDGPHGVRYQREDSDHLGLFDSEPATSFPTASATGSSWDPELVEEMGRALGAESRAIGVNILLGPGVNMKRSPLCGRNFEYFGEDPLLAGVLGSAWVRGIQSQGVGASVKHYAANNQETDRMRVSAEVDERTLREIYLPAFERIVCETQPATIMCSYNKVNGVYASQNRWLLSDTLRGDWGFEGYVVSDWGAVVDPVAAVAAGLDLAMPGAGESVPESIVEAVRSGNLDEASVDTAVSNILTVHDRLLADRPAVTPDHAANHALARRIATESSVLLTNEGSILPLEAGQGGNIAVIGEFARTPRYQGAGSSHIKPTRLDDALSAIRAMSDREIGFAAGFSFDGADDSTLRAEAVELASRSEVVVLFLGLSDAEESEGFDRKNLLLPETQRLLVADVVAANPNVIVVLSNGGVVTLDGIAGVVPAVLEMWLGGQASGSAAAEILFGAAEPGGRLAETIPLALSHNPAHVNWPGSDGIVRYGEGVYIGYRWYDATDREVAFPFGYGLSYTRFEYSDLAVRVADRTVAQATVQVTIENTGARAGSDVVQVYVGDVESTVDRPARELKGFVKVHLEPGERRTVTIDLDDRAFAFWRQGSWVVEPGAFTIEVGSHSRSLPLREVIELEVPTPVIVPDRDSTVAEWADHPSGMKALREVLSHFGPAAEAMVGEETLQMVGSMPLRTMLTFAAQAAPETVDLDEIIESLLSEVQQAGPVPA
ncbi:glycoside hydrolase family 3 C-terminal domain-containing protein [Naasia sp. SYSU D00057]|uniref:glycoside hydrolase family 3 C-terminal domain-containing protein n=1 Tax=Naasia sp. SYSU D00057 TaxID=2817380 RepID=UPI001B30746D|nr:glycoside hydrolase family 3 C-terminal domain-containing protein [Naasia sp. SYSU D00057]